MEKSQRPVIEVSHVNFSYNGSPVLTDVSLTVSEREFLAFIGPNGGGKTTLLKLMLGLLKPDSGSIRIFDRPPAEASHRIGYVPQDVTYNRSFPISVMDVVLMGRMRFHGKRLTRKDRAAARQALEQLEMHDHRNTRIDDLSGGQKERVFIARALATEPHILFMDEPTANLDNAGRSDLYALLKEINRTRTIIVVSHDMMVLSSYVTSVACISNSLHYHGRAEITEGMLDMGYQCPVELIAHGLPHRVLKPHGGNT